MKTLKELINEIIIERISFFRGNKSQAAYSLGISVRGMRLHVRRLEKLGLIKRSWYSNRKH